MDGDARAVRQRTHTGRTDGARAHMSGTGIGNETAPAVAADEASALHRYMRDPFDGYFESGFGQRRGAGGNYCDACLVRG